MDETQTLESHATPPPKPIAVNFHLWKHCNLKCRFCYAVFDDVPGHLSAKDACRLVGALAGAGCDKLTLVGGEPTLCPHLGQVLREARAAGLTTCVVTNGARLEPLLAKEAAYIDWIGLSVDSAAEAIQERLGRGKGDHVRQSIAHAERVHALGLGLKLNTVVTALNHDEDLSGFVRRIRPDRWKVFQLLPVGGQNDGCEHLHISTSQFRAFVDRHAPLADEGFAPIAEDNEAMRGSYVMIDPLGRFFDNVDGRYVYSQSILEVGVETALAQTRWEHARLIARDGLYPWKRNRP